MVITTFIDLTRTTMVYRLAYMKKSGNRLSRCPDFVIHYKLSRITTTREMPEYGQKSVSVGFFTTVNYVDPAVPLFLVMIGSCPGQCPPVMLQKKCIPV